MRRSATVRTVCRTIVAIGVTAATLALPTGVARAVEAPLTSVTMVSESGDYIGAGASFLFHPGDSEITLRGTPGEVTVDVSGGSSGAYYTLQVAAPPGEVLEVGSYEGVQRAPFREAGRAGLDIGGSGRGCNAVAGRFTVLDIAYTADTVTRLHVLYEQHCEGGDPALFGEIRYELPGGDSDVLLAPGHVAWPAMLPGEPARPVPVTVVNTGTERITPGTPSVSGEGAEAFSVVSNTCTSPVEPGGSCVAHARFAAASAGVSTAELAFPDSTALDGRRVVLTGEGESGHTSWRMRGDEGDYISQGQLYSWTPAEARISARGGETYVAVGVEAPDGYYTAEFAPGRNDVLLPGVTYSAARRYPFHDPSPGLSISGSGRGCNTLTGSFTVHELVIGREGLESFSVTFEQHCEGSEPALHGSIAYKAEAAARPLPGEPEPEPDPDPEPEPGTPRFSDTAGTTHASSIEIVAREGIAAGYADGTFRPGEPVTRGQMASFLARGLELSPAPSAGFTDTAGNVHEAAIDALAAEGITGGFSDGSFRPQLPVTRGQLASLLQRALELPPAEQRSFTDVEGDVHAEAIEAVAQAGIAQGFDDRTYRPALSVTRGQMASFLVRALDLEP